MTERCWTNCAVVLRQRSLLGLLCLLVVGMCISCRDAQRATGSVGSAQRIVSLSPAVTETLFALGLGESVVAVSDYCHEPKVVDALPRAGTIFAPRLEAVVAARPSIIVAERIDGTNVGDLSKLCQTAMYRWLTYDDVIRSTSELGRQFGRVQQAEQLVAHYELALRVDPPTQRQRVLLALAQVPGQLTEIWYIRRNSMHGRALEAAGAINAAQDQVLGPPRLGLERAIELDPDAIIVLDPRVTANPALLEDYRRLTGMRAIREGRLALVAAPELEVPGPRIAQFVDRLRHVLADFAPRAANPAESAASSAGMQGRPE